MKSKISFINRTMLQKNVKLYWPIWTLYTIVLLLNGPFSMWSRFKNAEFIYGKSTHNRRERPVYGHRGGSRGRFYYRITTFEERPWDARDPH